MLPSYNHNAVTIKQQQRNLGFFVVTREVRVCVIVAEPKQAFQQLS